MQVCYKKQIIVNIICAHIVKYNKECITIEIVLVYGHGRRLLLCNKECSVLQGCLFMPLFLIKI